MDPDIAKTEAAIVEYTNAFRREEALGRLAIDSKLRTAALSYARFLASSPNFSHTADGRRPSDRIKAAGFDACSTAENLAWMSHSNGFGTLELARRMVEGWKNSPGHRKNMLLKHATETGVAVVKVKGQQKYMAVQLFGRPMRMAFQFTVENGAGRRVQYTVAGQRQTAEPNMIIEHTACEPTEIDFEGAAGGASTSTGFFAQFVTRKGATYRLTKGRAGQVRVDVVAAPK